VTPLRAEGTQKTRNAKAARMLRQRLTAATRVPSVLLCRGAASLARRRSRFRRAPQRTSSRAPCLGSTLGRRPPAFYRRCARIRARVPCRSARALVLRCMVACCAAAAAAPSANLATVSAARRSRLSAQASRRVGLVARAELQSLGAALRRFAAAAGMANAPAQPWRDPNCFTTDRWWSDKTVAVVRRCQSKDAGAAPALRTPRLTLCCLGDWRQQGHRQGDRAAAECAGPDGGADVTRRAARR